MRAQESLSHGVKLFPTGELKLEEFKSKCQQVLDKLWNLESKKHAGNAEYDKGNHQRAVELYSVALEIDPEHVLFNRHLFANRAAAFLKLSKFKEAIKDCSQAIELDSKYVKACHHSFLCITFSGLSATSQNLCFLGTL